MNIKNDEYNKYKTKDDIEKYFVLKMNEYLNNVLQYQFNNYICDMEEHWESSNDELKNELKNYIRESQFVKDKKLHSHICNLFNYDKKDVVVNIYNHMCKFFHQFEFYPYEDWWTYHYDKYEFNSNVWKNE